MNDYTIFKILKRLNDLESSGGSGSGIEQLEPKLSGSSVFITHSAYIFNSGTKKIYYFNTNQSVGINDAAPNYIRYDLVYITGNGVLSKKEGTPLIVDNMEGSSPEVEPDVIPIALVRVEEQLKELIDIRFMINYSSVKPEIEFGTLLIKI